MKEVGTKIALLIKRRDRYIDSKARSSRNCSARTFSQSHRTIKISLSTQPCGAQSPTSKRTWTRLLSTFTTPLTTTMMKTTSFPLPPSPIAAILTAPRIPYRFLGRRLPPTEHPITPTLLRYVVIKFAARLCDYYLLLRCDNGKWRWILEC